MILVLYTKHCSLRQIAEETGRSVSTISRELHRNRTCRQPHYSAVRSHNNYHSRRRRCKRRLLLEDAKLKRIVSTLFWECQWSPEQIAHRLLHEGSPYRISTTTIYRAIYRGFFERRGNSVKDRSAKKNLRHQGRRRRRKGEKKSNIGISHRIAERPKEVADRKTIGDWEGDLVIGKAGSACLLTMTERVSRYLLTGKLKKKTSSEVNNKMIELLSPLPQQYRRSMTLDRGSEFAKHEKVSSALEGLLFYFADAHSPWQRGTNENTNGLLREYLPKSFDMAVCPKSEIAWITDKLNHRPRKCLGWKTPYEVFFNEVLHLI